MRRPTSRFDCACRGRPAAFRGAAVGGEEAVPDRRRRWMERQGSPRSRGVCVAHEVPVGVSFRCQDYFDNLHPCYGGHIGIGLDENRRTDSRQRSDDRAGRRLGEITTSGYRLFDIPKPRQPLVHVYPDPEEIGRVYAPTLGVVASSAALRRRSSGWSRSIDRAPTMQGGACRLPRLCRADALAGRRAALADRARSERSLAP